MSGTGRPLGAALFDGYHPSLAQLLYLAKTTVTQPNPIHFKRMSSTATIGPQEQRQETRCLSGLVRCHRTINDKYTVGRQGGMDAAEKGGVLCFRKVVRDLP